MDISANPAGKFAGHVAFGTSPISGEVTHHKSGPTHPPFDRWKTIREESKRPWYEGPWKSYAGALVKDIGRNIWHEATKEENPNKDYPDAEKAYNFYRNYTKSLQRIGEEKELKRIQEEVANVVDHIRLERTQAETERGIVQGAMQVFNTFIDPKDLLTQEGEEYKETMKKFLHNVGADLYYPLISQGIPDWDSLGWTEQASALLTWLRNPLTYMGHMTGERLDKMSQKEYRLRMAVNAADYRYLKSRQKARQQQTKGISKYQTSYNEPFALHNKDEGEIAMVQKKSKRKYRKTKKRKNKRKRIYF